MGIRKPKDANMISPKPNSKTNDHVARLRVVQEVSSRNSSASWNSSCTFSTEQSLQDQPRPPVYNVEDYAGSLRKFGKRGPTADKDNTAEPMKQTEMTLKEFTSTTELLEKLKADLKLAYFSFVQEFVGDPIDGITLLLELLKTIQQNGSQTKCTPANQRRITLDENSCLQCLKYCLRCQDAARKLAISSAGLYTLAASIMSTVNQSRLLTLELLTKACSESGTAEGHNTVSDAMSTMRLRFAEPVRFRFLVGMMSGNGGGSGMELLLAGLKFVNAFTETCPDLQTKFYVQAELKQAGFKPAAILKNISNKSPLLSSVSDEIYRWQKNFINVESLKRQHDEVVREAKSLREKVVMLEKKIHLLQDEKRVISSRIDHADGSLQKNKIEGGGGGNSAEDEGISSSEQDDCEEDVPSKKVNVSTYKMYNLCQDDTAVAKVLEGFDKVINDAGSSGRKGSSSTSSGGDVVMKRRSYHEYSDADDAVIIPARIVPEPPRRSRSLFVNKNFEVNPFFEDDEESADSECAYEDEDEDDDGEEKSRLKRSETFRTVQNQIKRFSAMAMRHDDIRTGPPAEDKTGNEGRRKSLYNVFGRVPDSTDKPAVTRSASTRNVNDSSRIPVVRFDHCKSERRPVYLPAGGGGGPCRDANKEPKVFVARGHNNAGLYSGYKDTAAATVDETVITGAARTYKPGSNGLRTHRNVMSVSTGKLTDFPSGLY